MLWDSMDRCLLCAHRSPPFCITKPLDAYVPIHSNHLPHTPLELRAQHCQLIAGHESSEDYYSPMRYAFTVTLNPLTI